MSQSRSPECGSPRIYVVDDEWIIAETLAAILAKDGYRSQAFHNPSQALVRAMGEPPDVLIADVMMPGMSGIEMAVALRRAGHDFRILLFSGQSRAIDLLHDAQRRGYDFELLDKPLHPLQLLLRLQNMRHRHQRSAERVETPSQSEIASDRSDPGSMPAAG